MEINCLVEEAEGRTAEKVLEQGYGGATRLENKRNDKRQQERATGGRGENGFQTRQRPWLCAPQTRLWEITGSTGLDEKATSLELSGLG
jgi:hypothetical protein